MGRPKEFKREDLLDKAIQVFWKKGFADTRLHNIEIATGVNKSGIYNEFKNKDALFIACLERYKNESPVVSVLNQPPLGIGNIEDYLALGLSSQGEKGCFIVNTLRELSICPHGVEKIIEYYTQDIAENLIKNLVVLHPETDILVLTNLILTFSTGLNIKLNMITPTQAKEEINAFVGLLKKLLS